MFQYNLLLSFLSTIYSIILLVFSVFPLPLSPLQILLFTLSFCFFPPSSLIIYCTKWVRKRDRKRVEEKTYVIKIDWLFPPVIWSLSHFIINKKTNYIEFHSQQIVLYCRHVEGDFHWFPIDKMIELNENICPNSSMDWELCRKDRSLSVINRY